MCHLHYSAHTCAYYLYIGVIDMKKSFLSILVLLLFVVLPVWADDTPTYQYIQFSGNGRTVLLDTNGALSVVNATDDAPVGDGYQWTLEASTTTSGTVLLKSKVGHYVSYDATAHTFGTTSEAAAATTFTQTANTYYSKTVSGSRYNLTISTLTGKNALAVKNGQLTLTISNARYSAIRLASSVKGPTIHPLLSTEGNEHWYYMEMLRNGSECIKDATDGSKLQKANTPKPKYLNAYMWSVYEANEQGDVYFKSKDGHYIAQTDGTYQYVTSNENSRNNSGRYQICDVADNNGYAGTFILYNQATARYIMPYPSGNPDVGLSYRMNADERMRFIEVDTRVLTTPHVLQFTEGGSIALYDVGADGQVSLKATTNATSETANYTWTFEPITGKTDAYALKSGLGNYLRYADNAFSTTTQLSEALAVFPNECAYDGYNTRYTITLADNASQALGYHGNTLVLTNANSLYAVTHLANSLSEVKGEPAPQLSDINGTYYYKIQFKANAAGNTQLTLTTNNFAAPVVAIEADPAVAQRNWIFKQSQHPQSQRGDFYIMNHVGEYLCFDGSKFYINAQFDVNNTTVYRLIQSVTDPTCWSIEMPLMSGNDRMVGLSATDQKDYAIKLCGATSAYNALTFKATPYVSMYNYAQFSGSGRSVLYEHDGQLSVVETTASQLDGDGYQWTYELAAHDGQNVGIYVKAKTGRYLKYDADTKQFSSVANREDATILMRSNNTYFSNTAGGWRFNYAIYGNTDTYNTIGVKNGRLQLVKSNSRYAAVRYATDIKGATFIPYVSTADKQYFYHIDMRCNGSEFLADNTSGQLLHKTSNRMLPLKILRWSLYEANDDGDIYIKSFAGNYIYLNGGDQYVTNDETLKINQGRYKLCDVADQSDAAYDEHWVIYSCTGNKFMLPYNANTNKVGVGSNLQTIERVRFTELSASDSTYRYLLFPAMGMKTLIMGYDETGQIELQARTPRSQDDAPDVYLWRINQLHLQNKAGYYLSYADGKFSATDNEAEAYTFDFSINTYENNNVMRDNFLSTDGTQALSVDENGHLYWGQPDTRYSVSRFEMRPIAPKLPRLSADGVSYQLYRLQTFNNSHYNYTTNADDATVTLQPTAENDLRQLWVLIHDGNDVGDCYVQNTYDRTYLKCNTTATNGSVLSTVTDKAQATHVRLIENDAQSNMWQLQMTDASGNNNVLCHAYNYNGSAVSSTTITLGAPNDGRNYINFVPVDITPEFYDEDGGAYHQLTLSELTDQPLLVSNGTTLGIETGGSEINNNNSWKNVGTKFDFVLRNANGQYVTADDDGNVSLTTDKAVATHFYLWMNHSLSNGNVTFSFAQLPTDGQLPAVPDLCLGLADDGQTIQLLPFSTYTTEHKHTLCFSFLASTSPDLTTDAETGKNYYYFVHFDKMGNKYMCDGHDTNIDAIAEGKQSINDQAWAFVGESKEDFVVMSKDKYYLYFNSAKKNFDVTHDATQAAHFSARYVPSVDRYVFTLIGGANTENFVNWLLRLSSNNSDITLGQATDLTNANAKYYYLKFEQIEQPEDYSDYFIRSKRSWFVKQVRNAQVKPMTGFIQRDEEGWTLNPYTKHLMQKTSTYTITHYLKCQSTHDLYIPTCMIGSASSRSRAYQRWYNYKTDEAVDDSVVYLGIHSSRKYYNGLVVGDQLYLNGSYGGFVDHYVTFQMPENVPDDWEYILGADMTTYTDFVDYFGDNGNTLYNGETNSTIAIPEEQDLIEPTITGRSVFVIRNARAIANELLNYREGSDKWYEEKTIAFPRKKVTLNVSTVNLNMQVGDYWFYKAATPAEANLQNAVSYNGKLDIEIDDSQGTGITSAGFQDNGLSQSTRRAIGFNYPGDKDGFGMGEAKAEQCVLKVYGHASDGTRYQIAKFTLLFENDFEPRLYKEVIGKTPDGKFLTDRSPEALKQYVGEPVATITFDPDLFETFVTPPVGTNTSFSDSGSGESASQTYGKNYRYPFNYDNTSYCFTPVKSNYNECTWGNYTIANKLDAADNRGNFYPIKKFYQDFYGQSAYDASQSGFLYIDASDLPGQVVSIDFAGQPCSGSRLYVSAWMSSPDRDKESPANVVFHIQGIKNGRATTIYSYCPGPILGQARDKNGKKWNNHIDNKSIGLWQQVFFSFVNKSTEMYDTYRLTIDNACTNTRGGDILIDDIEVFALKPTVQLERTTPVCSQQITLAKMKADFDVVLQQLGLNENETPADGNPNMWYCIVDKKLYDEELIINATDPATYIPSHTDVWRAFTKALVGDPNVTTGPERAFRHVEFTTHYTNDELLPPFSYKQALRGNEAQRFKETSGTGVHYFIISDKMKGANLQPHHDYYVLFKPRFSSDPITINNATDAFELGTNCSVMSTFRSESSIKVVEDADDNASIDNEAQTCAGKSVSLSVKQNGVDDDGSQPQRITQYDWWRDYIGGSFAQVVINTAQGTWRTLAQGETAAANEMSLREALMNFRHFYPTATTVAGATPQTDHGYSLSQVEVNVLLQLTQNQGGQLAPLQLYNNTCNVYVPATTAQGSVLNVTVVPIDNASIDGSTQYCYDPEQISIKVSGYAPQLYDGLNGETDTYPAYLTNVPVRTSLAALAQVTEPATDVPAADVLRLPLRGISIVTPEAVGLQHVIAEADDGALVYLAGTTDPHMTTYVTQSPEGSTDEPSAQSFRVVGKVKQLEAMVADAANAHADIYFTHDFTPREGYTYTLRIDYRERFATGSTTTSLACDGALLADLVIVPKYQVWTGAAGNTDWTNDANWQRADRSDLLFDNTTDTAYVSNTTNGTAQGFVPMLHTSVLINGSAAVGGPQLYATSNNGPEGDGFVHFVDHEDEQRTATRDIEYALLAAQQATSGVNHCERYTTYQTKDVVLQPHAELLHSERLHYEKAWMEYALNPDRWYTLGSPLQQTYAGDWYAPKANAQQATPYFDDITFNVAQYNRFSPAVYQRSWDSGSALLYQLEPYSANAPQPANVGTRNVYQAATWSQVYNDVQTPYTQGGFSVKVASVGTATTYTSSLFRLPKEDAEFGYYTTTGATDGKTYAVDRTLNHRLLSDKLIDTNDLTLTLHNATAANAYYLVSNPFTCGLNMQQFFAQNAHVLDGAKYWMLTATGQTGVMQNADDAQWTVVNADNAATAQGIVAPGQGFFVKAKQATGSLQLTFTPDMMTSAHAVGSVLKLPARRALRANNVLGTLHVTAERNGQRSEAIVVKDAAANNAYAPNEDMEALVDNSLASVPTLYTLAGTQASSVNRRNSMFRVPLGVLSNSDAPTRLTFTGMAGFSETLSLLDEQTGFVTPLTLGTVNDSVTVEVPGNTVGRYYILSSEQPTADDLQQLTRPIIQVDGQRVVITSSAAHVLTHVQVVDAAGRTLYMMTPYMATLSLKLPTGAYVIEAQTTEGKTISKVTL